MLYCFRSISILILAVPLLFFVKILLNICIVSCNNNLFPLKLIVCSSEGPASFDPSDFPSLAPGVGSGIGGMPGRPNYGNLNKIYLHNHNLDNMI